MSAAADRHLLFGLLALQNGIINQEQLVASFQEWTLDQSRSLADHLEARGDLTLARRTLLEALAEVHLDAHGGDVHKSLTVVSAGKSMQETLARVGGPNVEATVAFAGSGSGTTDGNADRTGIRFVGSSSSDGQRFRVLRPLARGGLGAVFVAIDGELNREVALKQILDHHADDPVSRQRFLVEAEITGGLEHPGIVPVYGLGTYDGGRPYYAMRFIKGESLKDAIERFHQPGQSDADPGARSLVLRTLLRRFTDVCNTIEYAHSRGILHRDIKPSNVIVGKHGETLVVDWGLAKPLGKAEAAAGGGERMLMPSSASGSTETLAGSALGTPAYMSPEQAAGDLDRLGPRSDVYSLGATLYCLLTGKAPFDGNVLEVLSKVKNGDFARPRQLDPAIDPALEAVCLKAMATTTEDRYANCRALADDVERWAADEPVMAYRESWTRTLIRWLTRHRTGVTTAGAALLVALAGLLAVLGVQTRANGQLTAKNSELNAAFRREAGVRKEAETNFNMAVKAVDDYLTSVSENTLFKLQDSLDIRRLRQELLNSALTYYKSFVSQRSHDPSLRRQLARAYFRVGQITQEVESPKQAVEAYHQALAIWEPLLAAHPGDHALEGDLGAAYVAVGRLQNMAPNLDLDEAKKSLTRARAILEPLVTSNPLEPSYQSSLADCYSEIAAVQARLNQAGENLALLEKAKAIEQNLISRYPDTHSYQKSLAEITNVLGYTYYMQHKYAEALKSFREVQNVCQTVLKQVRIGPRPLWLLNLLTLTHCNIGSIQKENGEFEDALKSLEQSLEFGSVLIESHPSVTDYQVKFARSCREIAEVQHKLHQDAKARESMLRAVEVLKTLVRAHPEQAGYHSQLGLAWNYLGYLLDEARKNTEAIGPLEQAVAEQQLAVDKANDFDLYRQFLANHLANLGEQFVDLGRIAEGLPFCERSLRIFRELNAAHPGDRVYASEVSNSLIRQGTIERHIGDSAAAQRSFAAARTILDRWSGDAELRVLQAAALDHEANTLLDQGHAEEATQRLERALSLLRPAADGATSDQQSVNERRWRSEALWDLARVLRAKKLFEAAATADRERIALWKERPPGELVDLALDQLERALVIGYGKTAVSDRSRAVRELELSAAASNLRLAIERGFNDLNRLRSHPDSKFLLSRDDIELFIMDMAFPDRPFVDP